MQVGGDTAAFDVVVKTAGEARSLKCQPSWTLDNLKDAVEVATGIPANEQKLSVKSMNLSFYGGPLKPLLAGGCGITLDCSEDALRRAARSVLEPRAINGSMQTTGGSFAISNRNSSMASNASCGALARSHDATCGSIPSHNSMRSCASMKSLQSGRGEAIHKDFGMREKPSRLMLHYQACAMKKERERQKALDRPVHLRPNPTNPISSGCPSNYVTQQMRSLQLPLQMATNPKWSTDLKNINDKIGLRLEWERKMAAALPGSMIPELRHMPPKQFVANPPRPFFEPGKAHLAR